MLSKQTTNIIFTTLKSTLTTITILSLLTGCSSNPKKITKGKITAPPTETIQRLKLNPFYKKHISAKGFSIVSSDKVSDYAMWEAEYLINQMLGKRDDIRKAMTDNNVRLAVMAYNELTTQIPEHSDLKPKNFWDRRARGLGSTPTRPAVSCAEENLLSYPNDPYSTENILIHEFAHAMHEMGLNTVDKTFDTRLLQSYNKAIANGLWKDTYAATNHKEYWAEGVQSWFNTNRQNDSLHNHVDTREELKEYDPTLATLLSEIHSDNNKWKYIKPENRKHKAHLAGYNQKSAPKFKWPDGLQEWYDNYQNEQNRK